MCKHFSQNEEAIYELLLFLGNLDQNNKSRDKAMSPFLLQGR